MLSEPPPASPLQWDNRRILTLLALGTLIVSLVWRLPEELSFLLERTGELLVMLTFAAALTYLLRPLVNALCRLPMFGAIAVDLHRRHAGRSWATVIVFLVVGGALYSFCAISYGQIARDVRQQPFVQAFRTQTPAQRQETLRNWRTIVKSAVAPQAEAWNVDENALDSALTWAEESARAALPRMQHAVSDLSHRASFIVELLLIPVLVFYFLTDGAAIRRETDLLFARRLRPRVAHALMSFDRVFDGYVRGQIIMCLIAWALTALVLLALKVPHWFTLGLIAGLTRAVPVIGPLLGAIPLALVCLITTRDVNTTGLLLVGFTLMHLIESKILLPRVVGHEVDLHPVSVIVALLLGLKFFGFLGVFLSVPFAAAGKVFLAEWHDQIAEKEAQREAERIAAGIFPQSPPVADPDGALNGSNGVTPHSTTPSHSTITPPHDI